MLVGLLSLGLCWSALGGSGFSVKNGRIIDQAGRERYFHGVNVVYKSPPYHPVLTHFQSNLSFAQQDVELLEKLGVNVLRLGTMWPGVEPTQGKYNQTYLDQINKILQMTEPHGIFSLLDAHQDCLSEAFCGEGIPVWATHSNHSEYPFPFPLQTTPFHRPVPTVEECKKYSWSKYQLTVAGCSGYQNLYKNRFGLADSFAKSWATVVSRFQDAPNVVGIEILNEPFAGDIYHDPELLYPGVADKKNLQPFYNQVAAAVHQADPTQLIFFESVTWDDDWGKKIFDVGFTQCPGGYTSQGVLSYHYYSSIPGQTTEKYLDERVHDAQRLDVAGFVTEFGIDNNDETEAGLQNTCKSMQRFETRKQSWIGWEYKSFAGSLPGGTCTGCGNSFYHANGTLNHKVAQALSRPYVQAVQGRLLSTVFNCDTASPSFEFSVELNSAIKDKTEIRISTSYWYNSGVPTPTISPTNPNITWVPTSKHQGTFYELHWNGQGMVNATVTIKA